MEDPLRAGADDEGLTLIETLRWKGTSMPILPQHLRRLSASAARLGWPCDMTMARDMLWRMARPAPTPARLRLTLDRTGGFAVTVGPMPVTHAPWRIALAPQPLLSADPWLTVKSSRRPAYDAARADLPPGLDELVFQNERSEVCDGTITTLFFDQGDGLCTPPLDCGLLPGILRAQMLALRECREAPLDARDLPHVRLWVGNALRGLIPAVWAGDPHRA